MPVVSNTSPLVLLAKIRRLTLLKELYGEVLVPPSVKIECIDRGKEQGARDVEEIEKGVRKGWISLVKLSGKQRQQAVNLVGKARLGMGEAEALVLARDRKVMAILDDKEARALAESWDLDYTSTVMVFYEAYVRKLVSYDELVEDLAKLTKVMWISTDVIAEIIRRAGEVKR